ncbi:MAG: hypothetical protein JWP37_1116 [Mucilaginibacter sp.]|nr:hypothetical protein [Mucilaginibacter sp.]
MYFWKMSKNNLPTYAIVELLIRLANHNSSIGDYKNHTVYDNGVMVKTSSGTIKFSQSLVLLQFESPELITDKELADTALLFKSAN